MAELKTRKNDGDVEAFLDGIENEKRRADCRAVVELMADVTGEPPAMWGDSIIGFGSYHYKYTTGKSCLYIKKLEDVDMSVLRELVRDSFEQVSKGQ